MLNFLARRSKPVTTKRLADVGEWLSNAKSRVDLQHDLVVEMEAVETVNSREIGELCSLSLKLRERGRRLILKNAQEHSRSIIELTRVDRVIELR